MNVSAGCRTVIRPALLAAIFLITTGCATAPPQAAPPASSAAAGAPTPSPGYVADETPASQSDLVESADFALNAQREGLKPEVRNGAVVYCWTDDDIGSRIPSKKCVNQAQAQLLIQQRQAQRQAIQRMTNGACTPGINCGH